MSIREYLEKKASTVNVSAHMRQGTPIAAHTRAASSSAAAGFAGDAAENYQRSYASQAGVEAAKRDARRPLRDVLSRLGNVGLPLAAIGAGAVGTGALIDHLRRNKGKAESMAVVMSDPNVKKFNKEQVAARFNTLWKLNPEIARDPVTATSWIKRVMELGGDIDIKTISEVAKIRKDLASAIDKEKSIGARGGLMDTLKMTKTDFSGAD